MVGFFRDFHDIDNMYKKQLYFTAVILLLTKGAKSLKPSPSAASSALESSLSVGVSDGGYDVSVTNKDPSPSCLPFFKTETQSRDFDILKKVMLRRLTIQSFA